MEWISRKKPAIDIDDDYIADRNGIIQAAFVGMISFAFALLGISFLWFGIIHWREPNQVRLLGWLIGLLFTLLLAAQTSLCVKGITTGISNIVQRNRWLRQAVRYRVRIIDRKEAFNSYAEWRDEMWECSLAILWPPSAAGEPPGQAAWFRVSDRIYSRYRDQEFARILTDPSDPGVFLFEGE